MKKTPPDWGQDDRAKFLDKSGHNVFASYVQLHGPYRRLRDIDATYRTMAANLLNARPVLSALLPENTVMRATAAGNERQAAPG